MKRIYFSLISYDREYWWMIRTVGILFVLLGTWIILSKQQSYYLMGLLLAVGMQASGILEILFSFLNRKSIAEWYLIFMGGLIDLLLGAYLLNYPLISMVVMPMLIGIWMLFRAFMTMDSHIALSVMGIKNWIMVIVVSILLILPSMIILINPFFGMINVVVYTGAAFIVSGIFRIIFSQQLRSAHGKSRTKTTKNQ
ncbi:HdeD family acid-resistance protein [Pedobacter ureilyticus]|uniref:HdeD family acid-resistance protein n=1 Tax=Pedobacter ureilyticus TaxID=1393051 RepID=A0ABW9JBW2_9SPHI|nr:DUF308 domain-containing protein [Pedobacter helvus]